ncbi:hypothetical protein FH972_020982 [Carpinus fangiana]|uniref:SCP domain-containing protein n=1 Tax=Carpinus fangiana TaxID=176857 RepID=A0A5N6KN32_9ROSI|nr:hypothetical protein FH972_020982 [Carpinus fangiana]
MPSLASTFLVTILAAPLTVLATTDFSQPTYLKAPDVVGHGDITAEEMQSRTFSELPPQCDFTGDGLPYHYDILSFEEAMVIANGHNQRMHTSTETFNDIEWEKAAGASTYYWGTSDGSVASVTRKGSLIELRLVIFFVALGVDGKMKKLQIVEAGLQYSH